MRRFRVVFGRRCFSIPAIRVSGELHEGILDLAASTSAGCGGGVFGFVTAVRLADRGANGNDRVFESSHEGTGVEFERAGLESGGGP